MLSHAYRTTEWQCLDDKLEDNPETHIRTFTIALYA